ncbi:MAG TPA: glycosyltransferase family 9 protein [Phycisphaerae bacterium]|nr:glycosyltransferase family 9 protein [Phycisphaerae bacterium]HRY67906.1 glycosyltransferase family 9 protein [Phycisphaerae bacterium]HSA26065.1 glycosyltransferase family 9 protein [Phycisphaerae bacterium]
MIIHTDCRHFDGYKPCPPHKRSGAHCANCASYDSTSESILILKLGAAGEVIRCTPILRYLRQNHPSARLVWMTEFPDLIPDGWVDRIIRPTWQNAEWIRAQRWSLVLSLDKDPVTCAMARQLAADRVKGFSLDDRGRIVAADRDAARKWHTGLFDDLMKANTRHYVQEIFALCGWRYTGETYVLPDPEASEPIEIPGQGPVIGLNTGAGAAWPTRIWPEENFALLARELKQLGLRPLFLGGPDEHRKNLRLAGATGAAYAGTRPLRQFLGLVETCDVVVTAVTMALHIAIGLGKRIVLFNNVFNRHEFHLYGRGRILEPALGCLACYKSRFDSGCPVTNCMEQIAVGCVVAAVVEQVHQLDPVVRTTKVTEGGAVHAAS